jgi:HPt (histidine-containing phosphotransfer) domain-containing protein
MATIDWEKFNDNFQYYDKETIREVIEDFFNESEERLTNLEKNIANQDFEKLAFNAHSFKSVIGNFMAPQPYEICRIIEMMARQKSDKRITEIFSELRILVNELIGELKDYIKE